ncbi:DUF1127 domain-containing protein [Aestuariispira ectoiniformans]|uniref:DUF1127 domain-containing protein n=1 Tax=Aestuariispira ectoiniformans TaxID=2775080 RepID=UPI00223B41CD|nr:hypothetical protein [Aestuariispira ectoiniformans]
MQDVTKPCLANCRRPDPSWSFTSPLRTFWDVLGKWYARGMERRYLAEMECYLLDDAGISCDEVRKEVSKPFWRP